jgi:glycerophosphoryl diester phosphodiesterase
VTTRNTAGAWQAVAPLVVAHRGASASAPENTLAAFALALEEGADGVEFDVRLAGDGVPVVIHDATLERTALRAGRVAAHTSRELGETDAGSWFNLKFPSAARESFAREGVPTLASVFELLRRRARVIYVEIKCEAREDFRPLVARVVETVRGAGVEGVAVVESFNLAAVAEAKRLAPEVRAAALFEPKSVRGLRLRRLIVGRAIACGAQEVALHRALARTSVVEAARRAGLQSVVWTADHPAWARRALALGLRAVITNRPARMRAHLDAELARAADGTR